MTIQSSTMPRIIYSIDCKDPWGIPTWIIAAYDITLYQSQGVLLNEYTVKWSAAETNVTREIPYRFQAELKDMVIKSRGEWLDYFKRLKDSKRWKEEQQKKEQQAEISANVEEPPKQDSNEPEKEEQKSEPEEKK